MILVSEVKSAISEALDFCNEYCCRDCPKSHACVRIFDWIFLSQEVLELAKKCLEFNNAEENRNV